MADEVLSQRFNVDEVLLSTGSGAAKRIVLPLEEGKVVRLIAVHHLINNIEAQAGQSFVISALSDRQKDAPAVPSAILNDLTLFATASVFTNQGVANWHIESAGPIIIPMHGVLAGSQLWWLVLNESGLSIRPKLEIFYQPVSVASQIAMSIEARGRR